jgi:hypothetical protein
MGSIELRRTGRRLRVAIALASLVAIMLPGQASATMYEQGTYAGSDSWEWDDCGFAVDASSTFGGRYHTREGKNADAGAFYSFNNFWWREVHVPRNGGRTLVIEANAVFNETQGTRVSGTVFEFHAVVPGMTTISDTSGNVLLRDRGVVKQVYRIDTLGDGTPGGTDFEMLSYTWSGPHPGETTDLCTLF